MNTLRAIRTFFSSALQNVRRLSTARLALFILAGSITAIACSWSYITDHSVRFNSDRTGRGFYRLPPLPIAVDPKTGMELSTREVEQFDYNLDDSDVVDGVPETTDSGQVSKPDDVWIQAKSAVEKDDLSKAGTLLRKYLDMTSLPTPEYGVGSSQDFYTNRGSAYDILDAMSALKQGCSTASVKAYIEARYEYEDNRESTPEMIDDLMKRARVDKNLTDNWAYLRAAVLSKTDNEAALKAFQKHAAEFPGSEKHEAVLFMIARLTMRQSHSSTAKGCYIEKPTDGEEANYRQTDKVETEPKERCQDESWHMAIKAFRQLKEKYPHGRYVNDARGWIANLYLNGEETALALAEYYRLLGSTDRSVRLESKKSLQIVGHQYDDETLDKVEELISDAPNAAMAYAYHRIYNVAIDHTYADRNSWCCYDSDDQEEKRKIDEYRQNGNHELERVARFAKAMIKRYPQAGLSGGFVMRVAEAQLELKSFADADKLARKALSLGVTGDLRAQALWIRGSSEHEMRRVAEARKTFNQLIAEFPDDKLTEGARRLLAMTAEDQDDLETALEQYLKLKYDYDVAYFVDVLMPTDRLEKFVEGHKNIQEHDKLLYALGVRYMRDRRWKEARAALSKVQTVNIPQVEDSDGKIPFAKEPDWDSDGKGMVKSSWIMQDLKTIDILEHLENVAETAQGDEAKAEALYQLASYQYDGNSLMFYDPAVWQGQRADLLNQLSESESMRLPNEDRLIFEHSLLHEPLARAIPLYLEILDRYSQTRAAKDAMYSAVIAHERLSDLNNYWRVSYSNDLFAGSRLVTNKDIVSAFPHFRWPLSRLGWQASSRTVNGGSAYPLPPKPAPKLTRTQKAERLLRRLTDAFQAKITPKINIIADAYNSFWRGCFYGLLVIIGFLSAIYGSILGLHFWKTRQSVIQGQILGDSGSEFALTELPRFESRIEKVIENK